MIVQLFRQYSAKKQVKALASELGLLTKKDKFTFGKYKGLTVKAVLKKDPGYICWVHDNTTHKFISSLIKDARTAYASVKLERAASQPRYYSGSTYRDPVDYDHDDYYLMGGDPVDCGPFW